MKKNHPLVNPLTAAYRVLATLVLVNLISSCGAYKQSIMFAIDEENYQPLANMVSDAQNAYVIQSNDLLEVNIYTNKGELLIDPINALESNATPELEKTLYPVEYDGSVNLPILGSVNLEGLTLSEANKRLAELYSVYYKAPFVVTKYANKRVVVLGASQQKVVPLTYEGMNLLEVLALAGGVNELGNSKNIRLIRGDLSNPQVAVIDLSSIEGMRKANLDVLPNDIVYIEPVKKPFSGLRDFTPILSALTSVLTLIIALKL